MRIGKLLLGSALFCAGFCLVATADAAVITFATSPSGSGPWLFDGTGTIGTEFTVGSVGVWVSRVGYFDWDQDGLLNPHDVGIFAMDGTLLGSSVVPAGTLASLDGGFRWTDLGSAFYLNSNTDYVVAAFMPGDPDNDFFIGGTATIDPHFTLVGDWWGAGASISFPTLDLLSGTDGWFGPNFQGDPVPEPTTMLLVGSGLLGLAARRRRTS
jgi:hypothetical protein